MLIPELPAVRCREELCLLLERALRRVEAERAELDLRCPARASFKACIWPRRLGKLLELSPTRLPLLGTPGLLRLLVTAHL